MRPVRRTARNHPTRIGRPPGLAIAASAKRLVATRIAGSAQTRGSHSTSRASGRARNAVMVMAGAAQLAAATDGRTIVAVKVVASQPISKPGPGVRTRSTVEPVFTEAVSA